jgi:hypothetical protein
LLWQTVRSDGSPLPLQEKRGRGGEKAKALSSFAVRRCAACAGNIAASDSIGIAWLDPDHLANRRRPTFE